MPELVTIFILSYDPFGMNSMYYEAGTVLKTHPDIPYNDGIRRIFLYVKGDISDDSSKVELSIRNLLRYINESTEAKATDDNTRKLDDIVKRTKAKKDIGIRYMKSWEIEKELREEGREEERSNTERERRRADKAESDLKEANRRIAELEALVASK